MQHHVDDMGACLQLGHAYSMKASSTALQQDELVHTCGQHCSGIPVGSDATIIAGPGQLDRLHIH